MAKYFLFGKVFSEEKEKRITVGPGYRVDGGNKPVHEKMVEIVHEVSKECKKDPPQTEGELRMIVRDAVKKIG